ncbi:hypothetical protein PRZ48_006221 [Zasmidium cellare]|uniref:PARP catalytic domain-containing protein n=1 Tax=Zasmidium cellare TaxID=395010 RepID=A0ABR0ENH4_ZASCE|nr:hypothetical protein PRZ48_006221 [Zasmidium cellare]
MVRVNHFEAVPCKTTQCKVKKLFIEQLRIEGKPLPKDIDIQSPITDNPSSNSSPPRPALLQRQSSSSFSRLDEADRLLELHMPPAVICFSGSIRTGRLRVELPLGTLQVDVDVKGKRVQSYRLDSDHITRIPRSLGTGQVSGNYHELALTILQLIEQQVSVQTRTKTVLDSLLNPKQALRAHSILHELTKSPVSICEQAKTQQYGWHFLKAERIVNPGLQQRFLASIETLRTELKNLSMEALSQCLPPSSNSKSKHSMVEELLQVQHTFHGTSSTIIDSIAKHGLLAAGDINPATGQPIGKKLGSTYGPGVYVTQEPHLALTYCNWNDPTLLDLDPRERPVGGMRKRVIICASVLGRAALVTPNDGFREKTTLYPGAHSHVANGGQEYILPREQVLPLYVVDFDWRPASDETRDAYVGCAESMVRQPVDVEVQGR